MMGTVRADASSLCPPYRLIDQRVEACKAKDWVTADRTRDELQATGVLLEDGADGDHLAAGLISMPSSLGKATDLTRIAVTGKL